MNDKDELALIAEIKSLIATMRGVKYVESLQMTSWVKTSSDTQCGYVACILGHHVIGGYAITRPEPKISVLNSIQLSAQASAYAKHLEDVCWAALGNSDLVKAIYDGEAGDRYVAAVASDVFTEEEADSFAHLLVVKPTPTDTIEFMEACLQMIELPQ